MDEQAVQRTDPGEAPTEGGLATLNDDLGPNPFEKDAVS